MKTNVTKNTAKGKTAKAGHKHLAKLIALMDKANITAEQVRAYTAGQGHFPAPGKEIGELTEAYVRELTRPSKWSSAVQTMRQDEISDTFFPTPEEFDDLKELAALFSKISPSNRKKLADFMALADPGFVNKWLGDLLSDIMDPEWNNLIGQLDGYQAPTPKEAKQIAARVTEFARRPARPSWTLRASGKHLVTVEPKHVIKAA
jgi:hypothetical protein